MDQEQQIRLIQLLRGVVRGRWIIILGASGVGIIQKFVGASSVNLTSDTMTFIIVLALGFNLAYFLLLRKKDLSEGTLRLIKYAQVPVDQIIFTAVVYYTGGIESLSFVFYILPILVSTVIFRPISILLYSIFGVSLYIALILLEWSEVIVHRPRYLFDTGFYHNAGVTFNNSLVVVATILLAGAFAMFIARVLYDREDDLVAERDKTATTIRNLTDGLIMVDTQDRVVLMNPRAEELLGITEREWKGESIFKPKKDVPPTNIQSVYWLSNDGKNVSLEEVKLPTSENTVLEVITIPVFSARRVREGTIKVLHDITREKMIDRMKSEFISIAAHQLRTPLSAVKWAVKLILDGDAGKITPEQQELLQKGYESNERMISLVNDLLDVTRIEEGRFQYKFSVMKFEELVKSVVQEFKGKTEEGNVSFALHLPHDELPPVKIDPERMRIVLQNIIENAFHYTLKGGSIELRAEYDDASQKILVTVKDSGVGIPPDQQDKIFTKFFRAHNVVRMGSDGTGLGLYIVRNIVKKHGGDVWFESMEGKGTTFFFTIPIEQKFRPEKTTEFEGFMETI